MIRIIKGSNVMIYLVWQEIISLAPIALHTACAQIMLSIMQIVRKAKPANE
jgi:hypothetical protein